MVNADQVRNALEMTLTDYSSDEENVTKDELNDIANRFLQLVKTSLMPEANTGDEDESDG